MKKINWNFISTKSKVTYEYIVDKIFPVLISIVLAFQLNAWNNRRMNKSTEQSYLKNLKTEFILNKESLTKTISLNDRIINKTKELNAVIEDDKSEYSNAEIYDLIGGIIGNEVQFRPNVSTFDELKYSGFLSKLSNPTLGNKLHNWESELNRIKFQEGEEVHKRRMQIFEYIASNGNIKELTAASLGKYIGYGNSQFNSNPMELIKNIYFENRLIEFLITSKLLNDNYYGKLEIKIDEIIDLLEDEIK